MATKTREIAARLAKNFSGAIAFLVLGNASLIDGGLLLQGFEKRLSIRPVPFALVGFYDASAI